MAMSMLKEQKLLIFSTIRFLSSEKIILEGKPKSYSKLLFRIFTILYNTAKFPDGKTENRAFNIKPLLAANNDGGFKYASTNKVQLNQKTKSLFLTFSLKACQVQKRLVDILEEIHQ